VSEIGRGEAFCDKMESEEGWLKRKFRLWRTHPWMFVAGFAAGLAVFEAARLIFGRGSGLTGTSARRHEETRNRLALGDGAIRG
jgi:hypothetical protein